MYKQIKYDSATKSFLEFNPLHVKIIVAKDQK